MPARKSAKKTMPAFTKPTARTVKAFENAIEGITAVERRTMFGYPSVFLNGNMIGGIFQDRIMVRLSEADRRDALGLAGARLFEPMPGRAMKEYVELPRATVEDDAALRSWFNRARTFGATLPSKKKRR